MAAVAQCLYTVRVSPGYVINLQFTMFLTVRISTKCLDEVLYILTVCVSTDVSVVLVS